MKFLQRAGIYKSSNLTFNPMTKEGYSYRWWLVTKQFGKYFVFNGFAYSNSTTKHQYKLRALLHSIDLQPDFIIEAPRGLQDLCSALDLYRDRIASLKQAIAKPRSKQFKNKERVQEIKILQAKIKLVKKLLREGARK